MEVLVALVAAGESKTKAEAAEKLKISISALDKRLRAASSLCGVPLVRQPGDELTLTDEGQVFYEPAASLVELASFAEERRQIRRFVKSRLLAGLRGRRPCENRRLEDRRSARRTRHPRLRR
jgi:DNA-binding transcriptional LysR family regulator